MIKIQHHSPVTGSTWHVELDQDYEVKSCWLQSKTGKLTKVILTKGRDWLLWLFLNSKFYLNDND